jgi:hypothetical protein
MGLGRGGFEWILEWMFQGEGEETSDRDQGGQAYKKAVCLSMMLCCPTRAQQRRATSCRDSAGVKGLPHGDGSLCIEGWGCRKQGLCTVDRGGARGRREAAKGGREAKDPERAWSGGGSRVREPGGNGPDGTQPVFEMEIKEVSIYVL